MNHRTDADLNAITARLPPGLLDDVLTKFRDPNVPTDEALKMFWLRSLLDGIEQDLGGAATTERLVSELARHLTSWMVDF